MDVVSDNKYGMKPDTARELATYYSKQSVNQSDSEDLKSHTRQNGKYNS